MESLVCLSQGISSFYYRIARSVFAIILISTPLYSDSSTISETKLKEIAEDASLQIEGVNFGGGVVGRKVIAVGRNLIFQYDVPANWQPYEGAKEQLISNLKESGRGDFYFNESIIVTYAYFKINSAATTITVNPQEFSSVTFELGKYISIKDHPKSKGVNLKIKPPKDWVIEEGNGPNIVKKFTKQNSTFMILTKNLETFFSRSAHRSMYSDKSSLKDFVEDAVLTSCHSQELIFYDLVTVGLHPADNVKNVCDRGMMGKKVTQFILIWNIFYEDKMGILMGMGSNKREFRELKKLYSIVAVTTSFPKQFN